MPPTKRGVRPARPRQTSRQSKENPNAIEVIEAEVEIEDLSSDNECTNILLFGPSGHGKTVLAGGAPNAVFISTEKGAVSARRAGSKARRFKTPTWEKVVAAKKWCDANLGIEDWVILDSLTKMQVLMIRWILRMIHDVNENRDLDIPAIQDHQKWQNYFKRFVDDLIDAPYNVIFICGDAIRTGSDGEDEHMPSITGKDWQICDYVRSQTDINLYYAITSRATDEETGMPVRRLLAQPTPTFPACKDRSSALGRYQDVYHGDYFAMATFIEMISEALQSSEPPPLYTDTEELEGPEDIEDEEEPAPAKSIRGRSRAKAVAS